MKIMAVLTRRKWTITIILSLITGIIVGYSLKTEPVFSIYNLFASLGLTLTWVITMVWSIFKESNQEQFRRDELKIPDLKTLMEQPTTAHINYNNEKGIYVTPHEAPKPKYKKEIEEVLKKCKLDELLAKGITETNNLLNEGKTAIKVFHTIVKVSTKKIPLKKSLKIGIQSEPYMSIPRIREAIFNEIKGDHMEFRACEKGEPGFLCHGEIRLARGEDKILNDLKDIIERLIKDETIRKQIEIYTEAKRKLDSTEPFKEFKTKIEAVIAHFEMYHEFMLNS